MKHLTSTNPELEQLVQATPQGMAHWAGTGPAGSTCGECLHLADMRCSEFSRMMGQRGGVIPPETPACRHFDRGRQ